MRELLIPDGIQTVDDCAYCGTEYDRIVLPPSVKKIASSAFWGTKCEEVVLPEGLEEIAELAFHESEIKRIVFPSSLKTLGWAAFFECHSLESVIFRGKGPEIIESRTFEDCRALKTVTFGTGLKVTGSELDDGGAFERCVSLKEVVLPEGMVLIGNGTFSGCTALSRVVLPQSLSAIGEGAFGETALKELVVPSGVEECYNVAPLCKQLERFVLPAAVRGLSLKEFGGKPMLREVVLPRKFESDFDLFFPEDAKERMKITYIDG